MDKHSKPQPGKAKSNPRERISDNPQSQEVPELAPKGINYVVSEGQLQQISELAPKVINSEVPAGIRKKESLVIPIHKEDPIWRHKEVIMRCQQYNSNKDMSWRQKELIQMCKRENFVPMEFEIRIWVFNFRRGVYYSKI